MLSAVNMLRYRQALHLSYDQLLAEPVEEIKRAFLIWEMDEERVKLNERRNDASK